MKEHPDPVLCSPGDSALDPADDTLARKLRALSHPARLAVLRTLAASDACVCGDLVRGLPLAQSTVSQHIKVLLDAGLVRMTTAGTRSCYCIDKEALRALGAHMDGLFAALLPPRRSAGPPQAS